MKTVFEDKRLSLETKAKRLTESYSHWPARLLRHVSVVNGKLEGGLEMMTKRDRECGCRVVGNGTLQFPMEVQPCKKHDNESPVRIRIFVKGGVVQDVYADDKNVEVEVIDFDNEIEAADEDDLAAQKRVMRDKYDTCEFNKDQWHHAF